MINIDEVCKGNEAKLYVAILFDNAAMTLLAGNPTAPAIKTQGGPLVGYDVYRSDEFRNMIADPLLPERIKAELMSYNPNLNRKFTSPDLEECHVIRTPTQLAGEQLKAVLTAIQKTLESPFYNKTLSRSGIVGNSLAIEMVYGAAPAH